MPDRTCRECGAFTLEFACVVCALAAYYEETYNA